MNRRTASRLLLLGLPWLLAVAFLPIWANLRFHRTVLWDLEVYHQAMLSLRAGRDPYADGIARQIDQRDHPGRTRPDVPAFTYPYSPITLPFARFIARFPFNLTGTIYLLFYAAGIALTIYATLQVAGTSERFALSVLSPLVLFLPGLLYTDAVFSGNIAYLLYGLLLPAALLGWRHQRWLPFYLAALLASLMKAPMLILLAIPVLSSRRQGAPAALAATLGVTAFALQPLVCPTLFRHYLMAVDLQFSINRDFGAGPAGILADALFDRFPYRLTSTVVYLAYAIPIALLLLYFRKKFLGGSFTLRQWIPVLMLGVTLLNPRPMEYDIAPMTLLMALAAWRIARIYFTPRAAMAGLAVLIVAINSPKAISWRPVECAILGTLFFLGLYSLQTLPPLDRPSLSLV